MKVSTATYKRYLKIMINDHEVVDYYDLHNYMYMRTITNYASNLSES